MVRRHSSKAPAPVTRKQTRGPLFGDRSPRRARSRANHRESHGSERRDSREFSPGARNRRRSQSATAQRKNAAKAARNAAEDAATPTPAVRRETRPTATAPRSQAATSRATDARIPDQLTTVFEATVRHAGSSFGSSLQLLSVTHVLRALRESLRTVCGKHGGRNRQQRDSAGSTQSRHGTGGAALLLTIRWPPGGSLHGRLPQPQPALTTFSG